MISKNLSIYLTSLFLLLYFFYGFFSNENTAGAGGYDGDFDTIWNNINLLKEGVVVNLDNPSYNDSRPPLSYILHILFNPFINDQESFRFSCFVISLIIPALIYFSINKKYPDLSKNLTLLCSLLILLSPYFRTTAYWGLGENYGLIFVITSYLLITNLNNNFDYNKNFQKFYIIFLTCLSSSLTVYFDQKLVFIPVIVLFFILKSNIEIKFKTLTIIFFLLFSVPYLYLIKLWGALIPTSAAIARGVGYSINLLHPGYCLTIIAFYLLPFLLLDKFRFKDLKKLFEKKYYMVCLVFFVYLFVVIIYGNFENLSSDGKGIFHKILLISFENITTRFYITIVLFFLSFNLIYLFFDNEIDYFIIIFFIFISFLTYPFYQEYLDPIILILIFTFFNKRISLNEKKLYFLTLYFLVFSLGSKYYYILT